jgi:hypothetical protein
VLPDADKFLLAPDALHSLMTLVPLCGAILAIEYLYRGELVVTPVVVTSVAGHLLLEVVDGGPVALLWPLVEGGLGFRYPAQTVFGRGLRGLVIEGPIVTLGATAPDPTNRTSGFIRGPGIASLLAFCTVYLTDQSGWPG